MKIAIISPFPAFPPSGGNRARLKSLMEALTRLGHEIHLYVLSSRQVGPVDMDAHRSALGERFHYLGRPPIAEVGYLLSQAARRVGRFMRPAAGMPVTRWSSVDEVYCRAFDTPLRKAFKQNQFDAIITEYVTFSRPLLLCDAHTIKVVDTHDSFHFSLTPEQERRGLARANVVVAIQDEEKAAFEALLPHGPRTVTISHIVEVKEPVSTASSLRATFVGSSFEANILALKYFVDNILPLVVRRIPDFKLLVAGTICADVPDHPSIRKLGVVANLQEAFEAGPILVNPIRHGTGLNIKLLDAMALGVPTVSTAYGARGIAPNFLRGVQIVRDDDVHAFAEAVTILTTDADRRARLGQASLAAIREWNGLQIAELRKIFGDCVCREMLHVPEIGLSA